MSRDGTYILDYETQDYLEPTPMDLDKRAILEQNPNVLFNDLGYGYTIYFQMPKHTLTQETLEKLKADQVFESCDGDVFKKVLSNDRFS